LMVWDNVFDDVRGNKIGIMGGGDILRLPGARGP